MSFGKFHAILAVTYDIESQPLMGLSRGFHREVDPGISRQFMATSLFLSLFVASILQMRIWHDMA